jgi:hypothetical protein
MSSNKLLIRVFILLALADAFLGITLIVEIDSTHMKAGGASAIELGCVRAALVQMGSMQVMVWVQVQVGASLSLELLVGVCGGTMLLRDWQDSKYRSWCQS